LEHNTIACGDGTDYFHITLKKLWSPPRKIVGR
jgi:hypothetical protein